MFTSGLVQLYTGELDAAATSLQDAWRLARSQGNVHLVALAVGNLASLQLTRGQLRQTEETCERGAHEVGEMAWSRSPMTGVIYAHWGSACYARNDLIAARTHYLGSHPPGRAMGQLGGSSAQLSGASHASAGLRVTGRRIRGAGQSGAARNRRYGVGSAAG